MSFPMLMPAKLPSVIELINGALVDARLLDKQVAPDTRYKADRWSKAKAGVRPLDLHRLLQASPLFLLHFARRLEAAALAMLLEEERPVPPAEVPTADLVEDIASKLNELRARLRGVIDVGE